MNNLTPMELVGSPEEGDLVGPYIKRKTCGDCQKDPVLAHTERCVGCHLAAAKRDYDVAWTDKVVERAEQDPFFAARLKRALFP